MLYDVDAYRKTDIEAKILGASPHQLILFMLEEVNRLLSRAMLYISQKNIPKRWAMLSKAIEIISTGLRSAINHDVDKDISDNLDMLYEYMITQLIQANIKNDADLIERIINLNKDLIAAWCSISPNKRGLCE